MKKDTHNFICKKCGEIHDLMTLLEYPLPENISDISSGRIKGKLITIAQHMYRVNNEIFLLSSLIIPIVDHTDDLEIQNWIRVNNDERKRLVRSLDIAKENNDSDSYEMVMEGIMVYPIPFYGMSNFPVVKVAYDNEIDGYLPEVKLTISTSKLYKDWRDGITLKEFIEMLSFLYHL